MNETSLLSALDSSSLYSAHFKALKGKRTNHFACSYNYNLLTEISLLQYQIKKGTYQPMPYRKKTIYEPKERKIEAPAYRDRILHHALHRQLNIYFEKRFIHGSFACRENKGIHKASKYVQKILRAEKDLYVCQIDISKYYASINHAKLLSILEKNVSGVLLLTILKTIIDSTDSGTEHDYLFSKDNYYHTKGRRGIPIGNLTSQLFANIYLHEADMYAKHKLKIRKYVRYMDDILLFHNNKKVLTEYKAKFIEYLYNELYLTVNPKKIRLYPSKHGVQFVGYNIYPFKMRLKGKTVKRYKRKFNKKLKKYLNNEISLEDFDKSYRSFIAHANHANSRNLIIALNRKRYVAIIAKEVRQIN